MDPAVFRAIEGCGRRRRRRTWRRKRPTAAWPAGGAQRRAAPRRGGGARELVRPARGASQRGALRGELARDPADFRLVGASTVECLTEAELEEITSRVSALDPEETVGACASAAAPAAACLLAWLQAALALREWAREARRAQGRRSRQRQRPE
ncbi:unnamed protein product [Prorocentrum cordatum]|uniref:Uncharacterized protein n=1 Tax=Prorocentrum cordatum TaxID=2364126 RepID=A0ABN9PJ90_9DINO|nr:unnamed protein product [Polarella glacialis]